MKRRWVAVAVNILIPGSGLIILRREWLGFAVSVLFAVLAQITVLGLLIVPLDIPRWVVVIAFVGMVGVWVLSQWLVLVRGRLVASPELERELCELRDRARKSMARQDYAEAHRALLVAISVNDEDLESAVLWAELMGKMGRPRDARHWWNRVLALDRGEAHRQAALDALSSL